MDPTNLLTSEGESNNFEEDNEVELEDEFKVYNSKED